MDNGSHAGAGLLVRARWSGLLGLLLGSVAGLATVALAGPAREQRPAASEDAPALEVTHLPPLLTIPGERVELRYDVYCAAADAEEIGEPCDATGVVFVRAGDSGPFQELALNEDLGAEEDRYVAVVPESLRHSPAGFAYYAVFEDGESGWAVTLPAAGAAAPQRSLPLDESVSVVLGAHRFGQTRVADARLARASWGSGPGEVGLEQGRNLPPIGGAAFDVDRSGTIHVLDEANRRLLRWRPGAGVPETVPLGINGTLGDLSVAEDGTLYVLESTGEAGRRALLRSFAPDGTPRRAGEVAERAAQVRIGPDGPLVLQQPSGQWMPAAIAGRPLSPTEQRRAGRAARQLPGGGEVVVLRRESEIRIALVTPSGARQSWRLTSETPVAEVQLAEPRGDRLVLVARVFTGSRDEFLVAVLDPNGLVQRLSLDSADWAETAPLSRFRLVGSSLYQLGSTPEGMFVNRFDLEVR